METQQQKQDLPNIHVVGTTMTRSVNLSALIKSFTSMLPNPDEWKTLAIDVVNDVVVVVREVKVE
jgi:hypothetical protein